MKTGNSWLANPTWLSQQQGDKVCENIAYMWQWSHVYSSNALHILGLAYLNITIKVYLCNEYLNGPRLGFSRKHFTLLGWEIWICVAHSCYVSRRNCLLKETFGNWYFPDQQGCILRIWPALMVTWTLWEFQCVYLTKQFSAGVRGQAYGILNDRAHTSQMRLKILSWDKNSSDLGLPYTDIWL